MPENYSDYQKHVVSDIDACLESLGCQPILFVGSGLSRRYMGAPSWDELLEWCATTYPAVPKSYGYYKQTFSDPIDISSVFADLFKEWAWSAGRAEFPAELFSTQHHPDIYLKHLIAKHFEEITPHDFSSVADATVAAEIASLQSIAPHAIITTNYDRLLETIFNDYTPVVGQQILRSPVFSIGEIFKIHGCVTDPAHLVLTRMDYTDFTAKKKYLSAKLLTFFAEHPLLIVGYSASDPNIKAILSDIDEILSEESELIPNIYLLQWSSTVTAADYPQREHVIVLNEHRNIRVKCIISNSFDWVFQAFSNSRPIETIHPKLLRALLARTYDLVRCDIPRKTVEVDFNTLEHAILTEGEFGKLLGITSVGDPTKINAAFPYLLTQVGIELGYSNWHNANHLLERLKRERGLDVKASDNEYHVAFKSGSYTKTHKYSQKLVDLLAEIKGN